MRTPMMVILLAPMVAAPLAAQDALPSSTNPAERIVYRGDRAIEDQQSMQLTCYQWASGQTTWDPEVAYAQIQADHAQALEQFNATRGSAVGGAARGALAGLAIGAIAGDASTGAAIGAASGGLIGARRGNVGRAASQEQFEDAANEFRASFQAWNSHWTACMIGNGYGVG